MRISDWSSYVCSADLDYVHEAKPFNEAIETPGGTFYIDSASVLYLIGSRMDWKEDDFTAGFVFDNPNAKGACGCRSEARRVGKGCDRRCRSRFTPYN